MKNDQIIGLMNKLSSDNEIESYDTMHYHDIKHHAKIGKP